MKKSQKGFSLIELMIVVVIIGLLATVGVPQYQRFIAKTKQAEAKSMMSGLYTAEKAFFAEWNQYYGDFRAIGYQPDGALLYNVGFAGNGVAGPANHPSATFAGNNPTANFRRSRTACANATFTCTYAVVPPNLTGGTNVAAATTFSIQARANIDGDAGTDDWTLNQNKTFAVTRDDVFQ